MATAVLLLVQLPPELGSVKVVDVPTHKIVVPAMADGLG